MNELRFAGLPFILLGSGMGLQRLLELANRPLAGATIAISTMAVGRVPLAIWGIASIEAKKKISN